MVTFWWISVAITIIGIELRREHIKFHVLGQMIGQVVELKINLWTLPCLIYALVRERKQWSTWFHNFNWITATAWRPEHHRCTSNSHSLCPFLSLTHMQYVSAFSRSPKAIQILCITESSSSRGCIFELWWSPHIHVHHNSLFTFLELEQTLW